MTVACSQTRPLSSSEFDATIEEGRSRSDVLIELMHDRVNKKRRERPGGEPTP